MPRLIDHDARAAEITDAAWRVLVRDGARAVSVRNVAAEAGLATASLRRAFPTQADLLAACLTRIGDRVTARIRALPPCDDPVDGALARLAETMPLDDDRTIEMEVYLVLGTVALTDPGLHEAYMAVHGDLARLCGATVRAVAPTADADDANRRQRHLHALLDGLALHTLHGMAPADAMAVLREHLHDIARPAGGRTATG